MVALALARHGRAGRPALVLASVAAGVAALFLAVAVSGFVHSSGYGFDFNCYYRGAERLLHGEGLYLPQNLNGPFEHGAPAVYVYAPPLAVLLAPAALLGFDVAALGWLLLHVAAFVGACALMPVVRHVRLACFAVAAFSAPLLIDFNLGNVSTFVLFLTVVGWRSLDRPVGSIALALGIAIRPQMAIMLLWWLARRKLGAFVWTVGTGLLVIAATLPFVGVSGYLDFLRVVRNDQVAGVAHNGSLESVAIAAGLLPPLPIIVFLAGATIALGAIAYSLHRDAELSYVVTVSATLLLTPLLWGHYLVLLVIPAAYLAHRGRLWALALPLLGWLPEGAVAVGAFAGLLLPLLPRRGLVAQRLADTSASVAATTVRR